MLLIEQCARAIALTPLTIRQSMYFLDEVNKPCDIKGEGCDLERIYYSIEKNVIKLNPSYVFFFS